MQICMAWQVLAYNWWKCLANGGGYVEKCFFSWKFALSNSIILFFFVTVVVFMEINWRRHFWSDLCKPIGLSFYCQGERGRKCIVYQFDHSFFVDLIDWHLTNEVSISDVCLNFYWCAHSRSLIPLFPGTVLIIFSSNCINTSLNHSL